MNCNSRQRSHGAGAGDVRLAAPGLGGHGGQTAPGAPADDGQPGQQHGVTGRFGDGRGSHEGEHEHVQRMHALVVDGDHCAGQAAVHRPRSKRAGFAAEGSPEVAFLHLHAGHGIGRTGGLHRVRSTVNTALVWGVSEKSSCHVGKWRSSAARAAMSAKSTCRSSTCNALPRALGGKQIGFHHGKDISVKVCATVDEY
jgi:hypothetical protein